MVISKVSKVFIGLTVIAVLLALAIGGLAGCKKQKTGTIITKIQENRGEEPFYMIFVESGDEIKSYEVTEEEYNKYHKGDVYTG